MAMTADSTSNNHSPRASGVSGDGRSSPQLRRKSLPSPWAQVVRGESESASVSAAVQHSPSPSPPLPLASSLSESNDNLSSSKVASASSSSPPDNLMASENLDAADNSNAARPKKPAWNKPSNGVVEVATVMGADSWPALSESTKPSPKSSLADSSSSKTLSDGSVTTNQVPVIPLSPPKITSPNANPNLNPNRAMPARQRSRSRGGGASSSGGGAAQTGFPRSPQPPPPPPPLPQGFPIALPTNSVGNLVQPFPDPSPREPLYRGNNWETRPVGGFVSQTHPVNEHRNSSRRGNYGSRGDGSYHNNYGGRRDQDRGNYANMRDIHLQQQRGPPRGYVRPPSPGAGTYLPLHIRPFVNPMAFSDVIYLPTHMEHFSPFMTAPMLVPIAEHPLQTMLLHQIEYYFSDENLAKDDFLKSNMDDQGWVPITLIASFPRVKSLTNNIQFVLDSLRTSIIVEVQEEKVRRRNEWMKYVPYSIRVPSESGLPSPSGSSYGNLATSFQKITVEEEDKANPHSVDASGRRLSELSSQSKLCYGDSSEDTLSNEN